MTTRTTVGVAEEDVEPTEREEVRRILELLQTLRVKKRVQKLLTEVEAPHSGSWEEVAEKALEAYDLGKVSYRDLVDLLDEVEAYGRQHVFLYTVPEGTLEGLTVRTRLESALRAMGEDPSILATPRAVVDPDRPTLCSVRAVGGDLEVKYVETRSYWELTREEERHEDGDRYLDKRYILRTQRAAVSLSVDGRTGQAELRMATLQRGANYTDEVRRYTERIRPILALDTLGRVDLTPAIKTLFDSEEVHPRRGTLSTPDGCTIDITSAGEGESFRGNTFYVAGREVVGEEFGGAFLQVTWLAEKSSGQLDEDVVCYIYPRNEVAFSGAVSKEQVVHVLTRLRVLAHE